MDVTPETVRLSITASVAAVKDDGGDIGGLEDTGNVIEPLRKRKSLGDGLDDAVRIEEPQAGDPKKVKVGDDGHPEPAGKLPVVVSGRESIPPEIWHHIFTFCPPKTLGNLLCVNKLFNFYLDPNSAATPTVPPSPPKSATKLQKPNAIWQAARRLYWPYNPGPLKDKTELDMWRLACSHVCQFCGKKDSRRALPSNDPLRFGPGADGVTCIWAFREMDFLMSNVPSFLIPALPFVFSTPDLHTVPPSFIERAQFPVSLSLTKLFWSLDVENLNREFLAAKELGAPAVEEWQKGLDLRGQKQRSDVAKWEKFDDSGGLSKTLLYPGHQQAAAAAAARSIPQTQDQAKKDKAALPRVAALPPRPSSSVSLSPQCQLSAATAAPTFGLPSFLPSKVLLTKVPIPPRVERSKEEITQLKAQRRAEIIRRAELLNPPITEDILEKTTAFRAATQIIMPLDDIAWEVLKPRFLAQRAQLSKSPSVANASKQTALIPVIKEVSSQAETAKGKTDAEWDEIQGPVRLKILKYADEVIRDWDNGEKVNKENAPAFAIDVLLHVRKRFYMEVEKDATSARSQKRKPIIDPPEGPFTQKLTLENMKYVFDMKVRPLTESLRKELFLCSGCEGSNKLFGFDGVVQHYAAKHTETLSRGSIVVYWRAEWPLAPIFKALTRPRKTFHPLPAIPPSLPGPKPVGLPPQPSYSSGTAAPTLFTSASLAPQPSYPAVGSFLPIASQQPPLQSPFASNVTYSASQPVFGSQQPVPQQQQFIVQPYANSAPSVGPLAMAAVSQRYGAAQPPSQFGGSQDVLPPGPGHIGNQSYGNSVHPSTYVSGFPAEKKPILPSAKYKGDYNRMAMRARELWRSTANMVDTPGAIRVFTVLSHLDSFFLSKVGEPLPISLFLEGLSNHKEMRPVRSVDGLSCKPCRNRVGTVPDEEKRKSFSLPQLVRHFETYHTEPTQGKPRRGLPSCNWFADMLTIPPTHALRSMAGRNGRKYPLLYEAAVKLERETGEKEERTRQKPAQVPRDIASSSKAPGEVRSNPVTQRSKENPRGGQDFDHRDRGGSYYSADRYTPSRSRSASNTQQGRSRNDKNKEGGGPRDRTKEDDVEVAEKETRQKEANRTMWETERGQMAQTQVAAAGAKAVPQARNASVSHRHEQAPRQASQARDTFIKADEPDQWGMRGVPRARQDREERDLIGGMDVHLTHAQEYQEHQAPPTAPRSVLWPVYVDERGNEVARFEPPSREAGQRSRSPPYVRYAAAVPYRSRSPLARRYAGEAVYETRADNGMVMYERYAAQASPVYAHPHQQQVPLRQPGYYRVYVDEGQMERPVEYEIVRVRRPDNSEYHVRLPVRREFAEPGGTRYYSGDGGPEMAAAAGVDAAYYEEYDPRYPAAAPSSAPAGPGGRRQVRFH
ncbi:f-box domain containing protein [Grosmannia clavigera kw1407]|uniref:F-box domain containing protein n=1 Tax=Grosmannia clavigera (strain kw1407 / UAMH 11150) TaxID=655863 RepID=F0X9B1_GROCL|nr:f-box domain containing protein [Grosmannia clavigera kw1407]EFX05587.1 f-box domain containing protein [Grosmannia clavigera kw1407]